MDKHETEQHLIAKIEITRAAVSIHDKNNGRLTMHAVARKTDYSVAQILDYFNTVDDIKRFYYTSLILQYEAMIEEIDDFDSYTLSEKLSNFIYASFDLMNEDEAFVRATFKPLILRCSVKTDYQKRIEHLLERFITNDGLISASSSFLLNKYYFKLLQYKYLRLISFWLNDESENNEATMELTDKLTGLLQELLYTSIADRSIDLVKFIYANNDCTKNTLLNKITSTFEIR